LTTLSIKRNGLGHLSLNRKVQVAASAKDLGFSDISEMLTV
jgi:hypothetical protein